MSSTPSRVLAAVASLSLASCSTIGTINGQRLDVGAAPYEPPPVAHDWHPCEDFEWLCIVGVVGIATLAVLLATQRTVGNTS